MKPPKVKKKAAKRYDIEQTQALLNALGTCQTPIKDKAIVMLAIYTGAREGELVGLTWDNVDLEKGIIRITQAGQSLTEIGSFIKDTKNETSKRAITIPTPLVAVLKKYRAWQNEQNLKYGDLWIENGLVLTQRYGNQMHPDTPAKTFKRFLKNNWLEYINFHGLRHPYVKYTPKKFLHNLHKQYPKSKVTLGKEK